MTLMEDTIRTHRADPIDPWAKPPKASGVPRQAPPELGEGVAACSPKSSSPTAAKSRSALAHRARRMGIQTVAVFSDAGS